MAEDTQPAERQSIADRVRREFERARLRNAKGLQFLASGLEHVGAMERDLIDRSGTAALYRFRPLCDEIYRVPLLIVTPPSNKGYIFDLAKNQSFAEFLLLRGYDVFLLDWMTPRSEEASLGLSAYVDGFLPSALEQIASMTGEEQVSVAGYCAGGVLTLIHAALHPGPYLRNLIFVATPVDFAALPLFQAWSDPKHFDVDDMVDRLKIIPPEMMLGAFDLARPANRRSGQIQLWSNIWNDDYVRSYRMFDRWSSETLPVPGEYFREQTKLLMWDNALASNTLQIDGRHADLTNITAPTLNIVALHDHVVSLAATQPLMTHTSSTDREQIVSKGGHVSLVAGPAAPTRLWPQIDAWLSKRST